MREGKVVWVFYRIIEVIQSLESDYSVKNQVLIIRLALFWLQKARSQVLAILLKTCLFKNLSWRPTRDGRSLVFRVVRLRLALVKFTLVQLQFEVEDKELKNWQCPCLLTLNNRYTFIYYITKRPLFTCICDKKKVKYFAYLLPGSLKQVKDTGL